MKNNNILMFSIFGIAIIYMCISGIKVYAAEETNSITDGSYTVTIPKEVQIPSGDKDKSFDVTCNNIYKGDVVNVTVQHDNALKNMNGKTTIPYNISFGNDSQRANEMTFTSDNLTNLIKVHLTKDSNVAGTYTDTLTFNISSHKEKYNFNIRGYLEGNLMQNIREIANVTVNGINDTESNGLQYNNVVSTTKYNIQVAIKDPSKYVLSEVKNNVKSDASTGFEWNEVNNTITGTVAGDYASDDGTVYLDLYFVPKKYKLTFDANDGQFSDGTTKKTFEVAYDKPLEKIGTDVLNLAKNDPYYFGGWYTKKIEEGYPKKSSDKMPNEDLNLYAGWSKGVKVGLNGLLKGEKVLRGKLDGLGTADFIITKGPSKDIQAKSLYEVTDIIDDYFSEDEYQLKIHPNNGYRFLQLSTDTFHHNNADMSGTGNLQGRIYDQPISLIDGSRFVSFNVMFEPMQWGMDFTVSDCAKPSFEIGRKNNYTFNQSYLLPTIPPDQLKEGCTSFKWKVMTHEQTFYFEPGEDINNNDSFKNYIAVISKDSTSTPVSTLYFTAEPINSSSLAVLENEMDDSTSDLTTYSNVNDENGVCLQSNFNTISQPELGTEENKESEENTDGE